jgi:tRNA pseudouridine synthase 10
MGGERKTATSVEEFVSFPVVEKFKAAKYLFHASGREDSDVRMLGNGRPFYVKIEDSKKCALSAEALLELQTAINDSTQLVQVQQLHMASISECDKLKQGAETHQKEYRCMVLLSRDITPHDLHTLGALSNLTIQQSTPIRVLHRRTQMVRPKLILQMQATQLSSRMMVLDVATAAGTYVKEFVHGDFGRTTPSVGDLLGCDADILQLDVLNLLD